MTAVGWGEAPQRTVADTAAADAAAGDIAAAGLEMKERDCWKTCVGGFHCQVDSS